MTTRKEAPERTPTERVPAGRALAERRDEPQPRAVNRRGGPTAPRTGPAPRGAPLREPRSTTTAATGSTERGQTPARRERPAPASGDGRSNGHGNGHGRGDARPRPRAIIPREARGARGGQGGWQGRVDPARVAIIVVVVAVALCLALLLDIYLGHDPVHQATVAAFGPLAFLVPVGAALLALDAYRRHEGHRPWLRFEESCGAVLLFVSALTLGSLAGLSDSLVGASLSDELSGLAGKGGAVAAILVLLVIALILAFRITLPHMLAAARWVGRGMAAVVHQGVTLWKRRQGQAQRRARQRLEQAQAQTKESTSVAPLAPVRQPRRPRADATATRPQAPSDEAAPALDGTAGDANRQNQDPTRSDEPTVEMTPVPPVSPTEPTTSGAKVAALWRSKRQKPADARPTRDTRDTGASTAVEAPAAATRQDAGPMWPSPSLSLLDAVPDAVAVPTGDNDARARVIEETLASFNVVAEIVDVQAGPTVTQFGLRPGPGVRVQRITALTNDLALALAAPTIRIEAPVPGKPVVGIEIPNAVTDLVTLREIMESAVFRRQSQTAPLAIALGKNVSGQSVVVDLAKMPHLLIAGATGSGKSVCLNSLIACLLFNNSPEQVRLLMIDPKMVELTTFNGVPHLLHPVVTEMDRVSGTLKWVLKEMHKRYKLFGEARVRNLTGYNALQREKLDRGEPATSKNMPLPYIVFIIDELADLMMVSPAEVEDSISRLAALARATGIHLVLATQRPSVDVITGVIKANFPARIAFAVSSQIDSRTILDQGGAEKLMGRGDMLYLPSDGSKAMRVQGTFLSDREIERLVGFWEQYNEKNEKAATAANAPAPLQTIESSELEAPPEAAGEGEGDDKLVGEAAKVVREYRRASVSLLQRRLSVGYSRAARLLDLLEERGVVGPSEDGRSRIVLDLDTPSDAQESSTNTEVAVPDVPF